MKNKILGIQLIRGIACVSIVIMHTLAYAERAYSLEVGKELSFYGRYALLNLVDVFLVLSGFFASKSILGDGEITVCSKTPFKFWGQRIIRIFPVYWLAIGFASVLQMLILGNITVENNFWLGFLLLPNGSYFLGGEWTLVYDILFFILCGLFANKYTRKAYVPFIVVWNIIIVIVMCVRHLGISVSLVLPHILYSGKYFGYFTGCYTYLLYKKVLEPKHSEIKKKIEGFWLHGLSIVLFLAFFIINYESLYSISFVGKVIHYLLISCLILLITYAPISPKNLFVKIGNVSYGIYLIHAKLLFCVMPIFAAWGVPLTPACAGGGITALIIAYGFGSFAYQYENFVRQFVCSINEMQ